MIYVIAYVVTASFVAVFLGRVMKAEARRYPPEHLQVPLRGHSK